MEKEKSVFGIILAWLISLLVFFILLIIANSLLADNSNPAVINTLNFLNENVIYIVIMGVLFLLGSIFMALIFPFNLPGPLFNAIAGVALSSFILRLLKFMNDALGEDLFNSIISMSRAINTIVFILVILIGYIMLFVEKANEHKSRFKKKSGKRN